MKHILCAFAAAIALISMSSAAFGRANPLPANMDEIVKGADVAFMGTCVESNPHMMTAPDGESKMLVTTFTFNVSKVLKGEVSNPFKFTQWGASREDAKKTGLFSVGGMSPGYVCAKDSQVEYAIFLTKESAPMGLRTPIGVDQGKFNIVVGDDGKKKVVNGLGNKNIFVGVPRTKSLSKSLGASGNNNSPGPIDLNTFIEVVGEMK